MSPLSVVSLALAMSADAFAAAIAKGAALRRPRWREALRSGLIFGSIEALTPIVGWAIGTGAASWVQAWDHWIAFALLGGLGTKMVVDSLRPESALPEDRPPERHSFRSLALTGLGTSIDAMAVGVGLAFVDVPILPIAATIGVATFLAVTAGILLGRILGAIVGRRAELLGGLVLIGVGAGILAEHLGA